MSSGQIAIIGIGEVPTANRPERTHWDIIYDTCLEAIRDSGLRSPAFYAHRIKASQKVR